MLVVKSEHRRGGSGEREAIVGGGRAGVVWLWNFLRPSSFSLFGGVRRRRGGRRRRRRRARAHILVRRIREIIEP
jgi:hypothetical protein